MAKAKEEKAAPAPTKAVVYTKSGGHVRTYDVETHGKDFLALAKQMADQHEGSRIEVL